MSEHLLVTRNNRCLTLSLNRPEKKNALTSAMYAALHQQLELARTDSSVRVVLLNGEGGVFTSGNDLLDFRRTLESGVAISETSALRFMHALLDFPKPVVAAVEGMAIGIGATLLLRRRDVHRQARRVHRQAHARHRAPASSDLPVVRA